MADPATTTRLGLGGAGLAAFGLLVTVIGLFSTFMLMIAGGLLIVLGLIMFLLAQRQNRVASPTVDEL